MTHISITPAPARTDTTVTDATTAVRPSTAVVRRTGAALAAGTVSWAVADLVFGFDPGTEAATKATDLTGLLFQGGLMALLHLQMSTRATGVRPISRRLLQVERVLLSLAMAWSLAHGLLPGQRDAAWMHVLDLFWPLSMLGMFLIGIKVAVKGRWRGPARLWSLLAESWAPICVPAVGILGHGLGDVVGGVHLLLGYATLGLILAARPQLVQQRD